MAERLTDCTPTHRYLKTIKLNDVKVPWETKDMSYLMKVRRSVARRGWEGCDSTSFGGWVQDTYDPIFDRVVGAAQMTTFRQLPSRCSTPRDYKLKYSGFDGLRGYPRVAGVWCVCVGGLVCMRLGGMTVYADARRWFAGTAIWVHGRRQGRRAQDCVQGCRHCAISWM